MKQKVVAIGLTFLCSMECAYGQNGLSKLKNSVNNVAEKAVDNGIQKLIDNEKQEQVAPPEINTGKAVNSSQADNASSAVFTKYTFVPGEKIIYDEGFAGMQVGELPEGWNTNSSGHIVTTADSRHWLNVINGMYLSGLETDKLGESYTIEFDIILNVTPQTGYYLPYFEFGCFASAQDLPIHNKFLTGYKADNSFEIRFEPSALKSKITMKSHANKGETFQSGRMENEVFKDKLRTKVHVAVAIQKSRLQLWVDEHKLLDLPRAINNHAAPINQIFFRTENSGGYNEHNFSYLLSNIKVANEIADIKSLLTTTGDFSTTAIIFDVNSDKLKPQSGGTIKNIADALSQNMQTRIRIVGHTDSEGKAEANRELSLKRATAVKNALVRQFEIAPSRIEVDGMGAHEPIATNDTKEGRAANRRVQFISL